MDPDDRVSEAVVAPQPDPSMSAPVSGEDPFPSFPETYRRLVKVVMYAGATLHEAEDAVMSAVRDALRQERLRKAGKKLEPIDDLFEWTCKAALNYFINKTHGQKRICDRMVESGAATAEGGEDPNLSMWEEEQWVDGLLDSLPEKQREVMILILQVLTPAEIAGQLGGKSGTVRQNLLNTRTALKQALQQEPGG